MPYSRQTHGAVGKTEEPASNLYNLPGIFREGKNINSM